MVVCPCTQTTISQLSESKKKKYRAHEISWKNGETDMEVIGVTGVEGRFYKNTL